MDHRPVACRAARRPNGRTGPPAFIDRVLVCDIDGTLLDRDAATVGLGTLRRMLESRKDHLRLVYATGRSFPSTWALVCERVLPAPDAIAAFVGTEVWFPLWHHPDIRYTHEIARHWNVGVVRRVMARFSQAVVQPTEYQTLWKCSYYLSNRHQSVVPEIRKELAASGMYAKVVRSAGRYLDVIPGRAGKRNAVEYILRRWRCSGSTVLACGDSGNDLDMMEDPHFLGVIVGNSDDVALSRVANRENVYQSTLPFAAGVLEGSIAQSFRLN